jgi:hypothetical protein
MALELIKVLLVLLLGLEQTFFNQCHHFSHVTNISFLKIIQKLIFVKSTPLAKFIKESFKLGFAWVDSLWFDTVAHRTAASSEIFFADKEDDCVKNVFIPVPRFDWGILVLLILLNELLKEIFDIQILILGSDYSV